MDRLRVTLVQADLAWQDPAANRSRLEAAVAGLVQHTDLVVLPEMFATGFTMAASTCAEPMDGESVSWLAALAERLGAAVCGSLAIVEDGRYYNRFLCALPGGELVIYDKRHLFGLAGESGAYTRGNTRTVFEYRGFRICPQICYDLRFPAWSRNRGDFDLLVYVANWPEARRNHWRTLLAARAIENQCYVVAVNRIGTDGRGLRYCGDSAVYEYTGEAVLTRADAEAVVTVGLDREALWHYRAGLPFLQDADDIRIGD